jgi:DNA excision repair protein ERCC-2
VSAGDSRGVWLPKGYDVRPVQAEFIEEASEALEKREVFMVSAPCGVGKSLASLLTVLPRRGDGKLLICFRTRSQLDIYLKELKAIDRGVSAVSFISKNDMCPRRDNRMQYYDFLEECRRLRRNCETGAKPCCEFYDRMNHKMGEVEKLALACAREILPPLEVVKRMSKEGFCAYEAMKLVLGKVDVFMGTYHYVFEPGIRSSLLKSLDADISEIDLIVDEAHNLPSFARELLSDQLTLRTVVEAIGETDSFRNDLAGRVKEQLEVLEEDVFHRFREELGRRELRKVDANGLSDFFQERCDAPGLEVAEIVSEFGEHVREKRRELGYDRIYSYCYRVGTFLTNFFASEPDRNLHLAQKDRRDRAVLEVRCFDGRLLTDPLLKQARGSILMSGFLSPLEVYRDLTIGEGGFARLREFESPFPSENRLILAAGDVSSRFENRTEETIRRWRDYVEVVLEENRGNVAVFSTSYRLMRRIMEDMETGRNLIVEGPRTSRSSVLRGLRRLDDNVLFGVMGGKLSEGVDYPGNLLTGVVVIGLPYATWDLYERSLIDYYERQFPGRGRLYAYVTPAILRLIQACGRVHRSAEDEGVIVILDERVTRSSVKRMLPRYFQREMRTIVGADALRELIRGFWIRR